MFLRWSYIGSIRRASLARELSLYWLQKEHRRWICDNTFFKEERVVQLSGKTSSFQYNADSGNSKIKFFCQRCGSFVFGTNSGREGIKTIYVGTLDDASFVKPQFNIYFKGITICKNRWVPKQLQKRKAIKYMWQNVTIVRFIWKTAKNFHIIFHILL